MDSFFENARRIFDVARTAADSDLNDFVLRISPDGGMHFVMDSALSPGENALSPFTETSYRVTKSVGGGVRVVGRTSQQECVLERHPNAQHEPALHGERTVDNRFVTDFLRDQPFYRIDSPLTLSGRS